MSRNVQDPSKKGEEAGCDEPSAEGGGKESQTGGSGGLLGLLASLPVPKKS